MILTALLHLTALACDPVDWEVADVWPADNATVSPDSEPLARVFSTGHSFELRVEDADGNAVAGSSVPQAEEGTGSLVRFVPDADLADGDYTLIIDVTDDDTRDESHPFTVAASTPSIGTVSVADLEVSHLDQRDGDSCDSRPAHEIELVFDERDVAEATTVAMSLHRVAGGLEGSVAPEPAYVWTSDFPESGDSVWIHSDQEGPFCFVLKSWGIREGRDQTSNTACAELGGGGSGSEGCGCSATSLAPVGGLLGLVGLGLVWGRRRRLR